MNSAAARPDPRALHRPYHLLEPLPRTVWRGSLITHVGERRQRLQDTHIWLHELLAGGLPPAQADFGDRQATAALRLVVAELALPGLCRGVPALAEQVLRTMFWHLDRVAGLQPRLSRDQALAAVAVDFRAEWQVQTLGLEQRLVLLRGLGDLANLSWDQLTGRLNTRDWQAAERASARLSQMPELNELIQRLGRSERSLQASPAQQSVAADTRPVGLRAVQTVLRGAPGEVTGVCFSSRPERMLPSEAVMLRHPVLRKLWRARQAEARLLSHETEAQLLDWRADPSLPPRDAVQDAPPDALARGPIVICLDTSGSMRGAPENVAKAAVIAALRSAHAAARSCLLIAFGGPGEMIECELGSGGASLTALLNVMGQGFDGGTDVQTPIEHAVKRVHETRWRSADLLVVSDGEFGCVPQTLQRLDEARQLLGLRVQGVLVGDRETMGLLEVCDHIHWVRDWRRYADDTAAQSRAGSSGHSPVHSKSLTALYFPNALSRHAARHGQPKGTAPGPSP